MTNKLQPLSGKSPGKEVTSGSIHFVLFRNILKYNLFLLIPACFLLFSSIAARSQTDSLNSYLETAAKNNPVVLQKYAEYKAALQKVPQVGSLPDPELSVGVFLSPMELVGGKQVADIRLMQMFPWFGVLKNAKDEMSLMAQAKYETFRDAKLQLFYDVQRTWYELNKIKQKIRVSENNLELLHTLERLAITRFKAAPSPPGAIPAGSSVVLSSPQNAQQGPTGMNGMAGNGTGTKEPASARASSPMQGSSMGSPGGSVLTEVYRIQMETGELQNSIDLLKSQLLTTSAQFNSYLGRQQASNVTLPDTLAPETLEPSLLAIPDSIRKNNPMLGMLQLEQQSLEARRQMVNRMGYPMVGFGLNYSVINKNEMSSSTMNGKDMVMPMVTATLPIYRKKYKAMREEAEYLKSASLQNYRATSNSLQNEYYQALQLFRDANRRVKLYGDQYRLASKTLAIMLPGFASSGTSLSDILLIRQQTLEYGYRQSEAVADLNTSVAWLKRLGNIDIQDINDKQR